MAGPKLISARLVAWQVLNRFDPRRDYAGQVLNELLPQTQEKQRATDLVFGTIRNRAAIDAAIEVFSGRRVRRIQTDILNVIRIAVYELAYNPQTPDYSIVNEAVENARAVAGEKQTSFVNAVLRGLARHITTRDAELIMTSARRTLPQNLTSGCQFDADFLPDPQTSPTEYLSTCFSLPGWLVANWLGEYGFETASKICLASNRKPSIYIRPNSLKTTIEQLDQLLQQGGIDSEVASHDALAWLADREMIRLKSLQAVENLPGFAEGLFTVQDLSASQAVNLLNPQRDLAILDMCAAPGVKTTQLAESTGDSAGIIATDIDSERLEKVRENITRLGIKSITCVAYDQLPGDSQFDAILLDVPCSNTGVLARRVEARYKLDPRKVQELAVIQSDLLDKVALILKPGGKICYSTCSIQQIENTTIVQNFLRQNPSFELETENLILPSAEQFDHDGGYVAILHKTANTTGGPNKNGSRL